MFHRIVRRSNSNLVRVAKVEQIATVTIDNRPVNLLSRPVLTELSTTFDSLGDDESIKAVIMKSGAKGMIPYATYDMLVKISNPMFRRLYCWARYNGDL